MSVSCGVGCRVESKIGGLEGAIAMVEELSVGGCGRGLKVARDCAIMILLSVRKAGKGEPAGFS